MIRINDIIESVLSYHPKADVELIRKGYVFSARSHQGQVRSSGEPYLSHPLEVAYILSEMKLDVIAIVAGLLHDAVEDSAASVEEVGRLFGPEVGTIVDGVTKISLMESRSRGVQRAETIRKMIVTMATDIRVLLVKIADRLHNMRTLGFLDDERQSRISKETLEIYAPLAGRLGLGAKKSELEDLAFYYLETEKYREIKDSIALKEEEQKKYTTNVQKKLEEILKENKIQGRVKGRVKHSYSIYQKMLRQSLSVDQIFDFIGFRIVVQTVRDCYGALGIIHNTWPPIPGRFKDYVAMPKSNMYQSLHTTVIGPAGERIEIQIRTEEMDRVSEEGIAAHWKYKEGGGLEQSEDERFAWLRRLLDWMRDTKDPYEFLENLRIELYPDEVYVFTPKGEVRAFPRGAKPLDFAYSIHTDVGHTCTGARINGKLVPLKHELQSGEIVEIITSPHSKPGKDWANMVTTPKARAKIRHYFMREEQERSKTIGRELIEKELRKRHLSIASVTKEGRLHEATKTFSLKSVDDLFMMVGYGKISAKQVLGKVFPRGYIDEEQPGTSDTVIRKIKGHPSEAIMVKGIHDVLVRLGKCCNPLPGDEIIGFITRGRGVTVHTIDCPFIASSDPERQVDVEWEPFGDGLHPARLQILSEDKPGLLAIISSVFGNTDTNIVKAKLDQAGDQKTILDFTVEVHGKDHLDKVIRSLKRIKEIIKVERLRV